MESLFNKNSGIVQVWEREEVLHGYLYWCVSYDIIDHGVYSYAYHSNGYTADRRPKFVCPKNWTMASKRSECELE